jgi:two-component system, sensor histidine kinase RegB
MNLFMNHPFDRRNGWIIRNPARFDYNPVMNIFSSLPGHIQLRRLVSLRSLTIAAQLFALWLAWRVLKLDLAWLAMLLGIALLAVVNLYTLLRLRSARPVTNPEWFAQLAIDVSVLSLLLYYAGGSTNPFVSLYLLPLVIAAATLPAAYTWSMAALTTACYSWLMIYHIPLPQKEMEMDNPFNVHVMGMWMGFVISAVVVASFVVRMAKAVRSRDELLVEVREAILRNERIVALGTQAAGAAHELGTPLSTMAVVINELQHTDPAELQESLSLLDEQVRLCRRILDKMLIDAQDSGASRMQAAGEFMDEVLNEWQLLRPAAHYRYMGDEHMPAISVDVTLRAALMNLLNNAADASDLPIDIAARCEDDQFIVEIRDQGPGLSEEVTLKAGSAFFTTKPEGRGLGLFLANATIERMGGTVRLHNREGGGAATEIHLPIAKGSAA